MIVVLAGSFAETAAFAAQQGLRNTPHITNRDKLRGLRPTKVHLLPGYWARRDIHAINAELKRMSRDRSNPEIREWDKLEGTFVDVTDGPAEPGENYGVTPEAKIALVSDAPKVIEDVQASQVAALAPSRLDTLETLAADVDDVDDTDEFLKMLDGELDG